MMQRWNLFHPLSDYHTKFGNNGLLKDSHACLRPYLTPKDSHEKSHQVYKHDITKLGPYTTLLINYLDPRISFLLTSQKSRMDKKTDRSEAHPLHSLGFKLWNCTGIPQTATPPCRTPNVRWWTWWRWCNAALLTCLSNAPIGWRWGLVYPHTVH